MTGIVVGLSEYSEAAVMTYTRVYSFCSGLFLALYRSYNNETCHNYISIWALCMTLTYHFPFTCSYLIHVYSLFPSLFDSFFYISLQIWLQLFGVWFVFTVTLMLFPAIQSSVKMMRDENGMPYMFSDDFGEFYVS